jgi:hypothetical protein
MDFVVSTVPYTQWRSTMAGGRAVRSHSGETKLAQFENIYLTMGNA